VTGALDRLAALLASRQPRTEPGDSSSIWASVALIIAPDPLAVLLIRRAERGGDPWSGHVALPGGRRDPHDDDLIQTAIRETREEVGLELDRAHLLGQLDDLAPRTSVLPPVIVRPHVFRLDRHDVPILSEEVAHAGWEPLAMLLSPETRTEHSHELAGVIRQLPAYRTGAGTLWGMTERILAAFRPLLTQSINVK